MSDFPHFESSKAAGLPPGGGSSSSNSSDAKDEVTPRDSITKTPTQEHTSAEAAAADDDDDDDDDEAGDEPPDATKSPGAPDTGTLSAPPRAHSIVEKRYRAKMNEKIAHLDRLVRGLKMSPERAPDDGDKPKKQKIQRQNKTAVLSKAIRYIEELEQGTSKLQSQVDRLNQRVMEARRSLAEEENNM